MQYSMAVVNIEAKEPFCRLRQEVAKLYDAYVDRISPNFEWLGEILEQAKAAFAKPDVELLPKTPGEKRKRGRPKRGSIKKRESSAKKKRSSRIKLRNEERTTFLEVKCGNLGFGGDSTSFDDTSTSLLPEALGTDERRSGIACLDVVEENAAETNEVFEPIDDPTRNKDNIAVESCTETDFIRPEKESPPVQPTTLVDGDQLRTETAVDHTRRTADTVQPVKEADVAASMMEVDIVQVAVEIDVHDKTRSQYKKDDYLELRYACQATAIKKDPTTTLRTPQPDIQRPLFTPLAMPPTSALAIASNTRKDRTAVTALTPRLTPSSQTVNRLTPQKSATKMVAMDGRGEKISQQLREAAAKREELLRSRIAEQKRKREERALKVAQLRIIQKAKEDEMKRKIEEKYQTPVTMDIEEKRKLRPRYPDSAAKLQEAERKQRQEIERAKNEAKRLEHEFLQQKAAAFSNKTTEKGNNAMGCCKVASSQKATFEEPKDDSLASYATANCSNATFCVAPGNANETCASEQYDMTPLRQQKPSTASNYDISDLRSSDETDDEENPRKKIPGWAQGTQLKMALTRQYYKPPNLDELFGAVQKPDLKAMFKGYRTRIQHRASSAQWDSPIHPHCARRN